MYDIFISYSRKDKVYVHKFSDELQKAGYSVWIDKTGIRSSEDYKYRIVHAIRDSRCFIFFSSESANKSRYTVKEVGLAVSFHKPILPIKLDNTQYADSILFDLVNVDYIDATTYDRDYVFKRAIDGVSVYCEGESGSEYEGVHDEHGQLIKKNKKNVVIGITGSVICIMLFLLVLVLSARRSHVNDSLDNGDTVNIDTKNDSVIKLEKTSSTVILSIEDSSETQFKQAIIEKDWKTLQRLADNDYAPAYIPIAQHYMQRSSTHALADKYARKALKSGYVKDANHIINQLKQYHFYD